MATTTPQPTDPGQALGQLRERVTRLLSGFSRGQRFTLAVAAGAVVLLVLGVSWVGSNVAMAPLYTQLNPDDIGAITKELAAKDVPYELTDGGTTIAVPQDQVYQLRADLAGTALPSSGTVGYGVLDNQGLTTSEFGQRVGFQRAMEGELGKTIEAINGIETAVVHLAIPRDEVFALDAQKASASVLVKTNGAKLDAEQVQAIRNLVSSGIEGMVPEDVSIADDKGHVLAAPGGASASGGSGGAESQADFQNQLANQIETLVAASVGPGKVKATVAADLDMDQTTSTKESFTPTELAPGATGVIPMQESTKTETYGAGGGAPDTQGQLGSADPAALAAAGTANGGYSLDEAQRVNAVNKEVSTTNKALGTVKRLSVAVIIDESAVTEAQLPALQQLVNSAAGIDTARGDTVALTRLPFDTTVQQELQKELKDKAPAAEASSILLYAVAGGLALLIAIATFIVLRRRKRDLRELEALADQAGQLAMSDGAIDITSAVPVVGGRIAGSGTSSSSSGAIVLERPQDRREVLGDLIDNQPDEVAQLLRGWLADRRTTRR